MANKGGSEPQPNITSYIENKVVLLYTEEAKPPSDS